jgi:uncharacterized protein YndB with AHSA1/START domain
MHVTKSAIHIQAAPEAVWAWLTDPAKVRQWQFDSVLHTDWSVGSSIRFTAEWEGQKFEQWGSVLDVRPPAELRYSLFAPRPGLVDRPENYFTMTYRLDVDDSGTSLTISRKIPAQAQATTTRIRTRKTRSCRHLKTSSNLSRPNILRPCQREI